MAPLINIRYATEADAPDLATVNTDAFSSAGFFTNAFPQATPDSLRPLKGANVFKHLANPRMHVLAGCDPVSSEIIAYCRWVLPLGVGYDREVVPLSEEGQQAMADPIRLAPRPMNEKVYHAFKAMIEEKRKQHTTEDDIILEFLATMPAHQGKGIAKVFLEWGLEKADALRRRVYLEATPAGYPLYLKYGWVPIEEVTLDFEPLGGVGTEKFVMMMREPR